MVSKELVNEIVNEVVTIKSCYYYKLICLKTGSVELIINYKI